MVRSRGTLPGMVSPGAILAGMAFLASALALPGCERPLSLRGTVLVADSRTRGEIGWLSLADGVLRPALSPAGLYGDLARGPRGELYAARGREVLLLSKPGGALPLLSVEEKVDTVLPSSDGSRLYILEHPPAGSSRDAASVREAPHRLRLWDLAGSRFSGEAELDPFTYEIVEGPGLVLATHLQGRRLELVAIQPDGGARGGAAELELPDPGGGPLNRQALARAAAVEPEGRWALLVENGVGGERDRARLWTLELPERRWRCHPLSTAGLFQYGVAFLSASGGRARAALNGCDRLLVVEGDPASGFREGPAIGLPGLFHDLKRLELPPDSKGAPPGELLLLAGSDPARSRGFLIAVDPAGGSVVRIWKLPRPVDLFEVDNS
jgi:hypothetical protein